MKILLLTICAFFTVCFGGKIQDSVVLINHINSLQTTWTAGRNFPDGYRDTKTLLGTFMKGPVREIEQEDDDDENIPKQFDARTKWGKICPTISQIRDQGPCGSCWAFGAATAMSDRLCIATNGTFNKELSAEAILSCCTDCGNGCHGGFPLNAWDYWQSEGVPTGGPKTDKSACLPYAFDKCDHHVVGKYKPCAKDIQPTPECKTECSPDSGLDYKKDLTFGGEAMEIIGEKDMKKAIMTDGSLECAFTVYEDFIQYKKGVYQHVSGDYKGGHAIRIIGWGVEKDVKYWMVANSWNEDWGDNGWFKIIRGKNHLGIEQECVASKAYL